MRDIIPMWRFVSHCMVICANWVLVTPRMMLFVEAELGDLLPSCKASRLTLPFCVSCIILCVSGNRVHHVLASSAVSILLLVILMASPSLGSNKENKRPGDMTPLDFIARPPPLAMSSKLAF